MVFLPNKTILPCTCMTLQHTCTSKSWVGLKHKTWGTNHHPTLKLESDFVHIVFCRNFFFSFNVIVMALNLGTQFFFFFCNPTKGARTQVRAHIRMGTRPSKVEKEPAHVKRKPTQVRREARTHRKMWHTQDSIPEQLDENRHSLPLGQGAVL